jgi:hypothetical protein
LTKFCLLLYLAHTIHDRLKFQGLSKERGPGVHE